jgi:hypothetical protein
MLIKTMNKEIINKELAEFIKNKSPKSEAYQLSNLELVDFYNDLNAMHKAESYLSIDQEYEYGEELREISGNVGPKGGHFTPNGWGCFSLAHLNSQQKAKTFAKVISTSKTKAV